VLHVSLHCYCELPVQVMVVVGFALRIAENYSNTLLSHIRLSSDVAITIKT